ncbi:RNA polymerase sigma-70 factor [Xanthocytophaga agilis]|uniref:RNA polymerase sigma-70 factor n=1 Tax=Xanthocytophaga agilis TaxID=3048010 RepID=A0AAE3R3S2_9BACT|nr:RNA polymerase sigma-70 factor [Xanthocytophaga agilis]MDJ1500829.1 RNA polymerase sigma-70 factor [Xanthocytophaga agilis]
MQLSSTPDESFQQGTNMTDLSEQVSSAENQVDTELFIRKAFDTDAWEGCSLLFRRYYPVLCSHAIRYVYSREIAEDLVAEIFHDFWKNRIFEQVHSSYRSYLFKTVRNRSFNYLRQKLTSSISVEDFPVICEVQSSDQQMFYDELYQMIQRTVDEMSPKCQKVFLMSRFDGKKNHEIAEEMQISQRTVEVHISNALALLRKVLKEGGVLCLFLLSSIL